MVNSGGVNKLHLKSVSLAGELPGLKVHKTGTSYQQIWEMCRALRHFENSQYFCGISVFSLVLFCYFLFRIVYTGLPWWTSHWLKGHFLFEIKINQSINWLTVLVPRVYTYQSICLHWPWKCYWYSTQVFTHWVQTMQWKAKEKEHREDAAQKGKNKD